MVIEIRKRFGAEFPSKLVGGAVYLSGVHMVSVVSDNKDHTISIEHDIELGELRVLHTAPGEEIPECLLSVLQ